MKPSPRARKVSDISNFDEYLEQIIHDWLKTLTGLGLAMVPLFLILDFFLLPEEYLQRFTLYRFSVSAMILVQYFIIRYSKPRRYTFLHGIFFSGIVSFMISLMTVDLGGFESSYYAGINLVTIATILLIPWSLLTSIINAVLIIFIYVATNLFFPQPFQTKILINNLYFMISTGVISIAINYVQSKLVKKEFESRKELKEVGDALMGEMELAQKIQTRLLPKQWDIDGYDIAASMTTANEVGGDYYDVLVTPNGNYLAIGDVAGHGVDSGLIMMMTQTSLATLIKKCDSTNVAEIFANVNDILSENITRLEIDTYMTLLLVKLEKDSFSFAGKHQDLKIFRKNTHTVESVRTRGTWIGVQPSTEIAFANKPLRIASGDIMLLFTDGVTEAMNEKGELYSDTRLDKILYANINRTAKDIVDTILADVTGFQQKQDDDITLLVCRKK